jgi:hypothetical protein
MVTDVERFLVLETIGRQLAYVHRDQEALRWMNRAIELNIGEYGIFRRNVLITAGEVVARTDPQSGPQYTIRAVEVARTSIAEPIRLAEALGEHSIALWNAGRPEDSFAAWEAGVEQLLAARAQQPSWTQTFLAFLNVASYFSGVLMGAASSADSAIPRPGLFLALENMPVEKYQPIHDGLLMFRTAMFAEGIADTAATAKWATRALTEAQRQSDTHLLDIGGWVPIPHFIEIGAYDRAIQDAYAWSKLKAPDATSPKSFELDESDAKRIEEGFSAATRFERAILFVLVPIALSPATLRFDRDIARELAAVTSAMEQLSTEPNDPWKQSAQFLRSMFSGEKTWRQWHDEIAPLYANSRWALGILASLASVFDSPLSQSLVSQISLARTLERVFKISPSIRAKFVAPFLTRYWQAAIASNAGQFRTSAAYTQKAYSEAVALPPLVRVKKLLATMVFCTNLTLPTELSAWFDEGS